ncbi:MAG: aspartyl/asparaginyl beta-hydroxylase domain-containing protein [Pseudomonadota bacterium]
MSESYRLFRMLKTGVDVGSFLREIDSVEDAWAANAGRQTKIKVQRESLSIPLRGLRRSEIEGRARRDVHESRWTTGSQKFPIFRRFLDDFAVDVDGLLGRAKIVQLPAGGRVYPHIDRGEYYHLRDRYHLVLKSSLGSWMKAGDEETRMRAGELWWFDNKQVHEARNDGDEDRIHLIFDVLPKAARKEVFGDAA